MRIKIILLGMASCITILVHAQKNFRSAVVVDKDGKTENGFINYREWLNSPARIEFSKNGNGTDSHNFGPNDLLSFEITGAERFESYRCRLSMNPITLNQLSTDADSASKEEQVFLKVLVSGNTSLYKYVDDLKTRYYIKGPGVSVPIELVYKASLDPENNSKLIERKEYIGQLHGYGSAYSSDQKLSRRIDNARYNEEDFNRIVRSFNNNGGAVAKTEGPTRGALHFFVTGGLHLSSFSLKGDRGALFTSEYNFTNSTSPLVSVGLNIIVNPHTAKLFLKTELSWFTNSHSAKGSKLIGPYEYDDTYTLKYSVLSLFIGFSYNILKSDNIDLYLSAGPTINVNSVSENKEHQVRFSTFNPALKEESDLTPLTIENFKFNYNVRAGVLIKKIIDISAAVNGINGVVVNYSHFANKGFYAQFRIGYVFGKK